MKYLISILIAAVATGCVTARTKNTDPVMRVMIDPTNLPGPIYGRLVSAIVKTGKFIVVDRDQGFRAMVKEQELQHTTTRFGAQEKYSLWGQMHGAGGIFTGSLNCEAGLLFTHCTINLSLLDATTGEVMASSETSESAFSIDRTDWKHQVYYNPSWNNAVSELIDRYPAVFVDKHDLHKNIEYADSLKEYREKTVVENKKPELAMSPADHIGQ